MSKRLKDSGKVTDQDVLIKATTDYWSKFLRDPAQASAFEVVLKTKLQAEFTQGRKLIYIQTSASGPTGILKEACEATKLSADAMEQFPKERSSEISLRARNFVTNGEDGERVSIMGNPLNR